MRSLSKPQKILLFSILCMIFVVAGFFAYQISSKVFGATSPESNNGTIDVCDIDTTLTDKNSAGKTKLTSAIPDFKETNKTIAQGRYSEDNPFVVLEIVSDKAYQYMSYLNPGDEPFTIEPVEQKLNENEGNVPTAEDVESNYYQNNSSPFFGNICNFKVTVDGSIVTKKAAKFISKKVTIKAAKGSSDFMTKYNADVKSYAGAYKENRWTEVSTKEESRTGYYIRVHNGAGNFKPYYNWNKGGFLGFEETSANGGDWTYSDTAPTGGTLLSGSSNVLNWTSDSEVDTKQYYYEAKGLTSLVPCDAYSYAYYYRYESNDVLKRMLFTVSEAVYDKIHMKVVVMTPKEVNAAMKGDTAEKVDIIERADMIYFNGQMYNGGNSYGNYAQELQSLFQFYFKYSKDDTRNITDYSKLGVYDDDNDIDWMAAEQAILKISQNSNFPVLMNSEALYGLNERNAKYRQFYKENIEGNLSCGCNTSANNATTMNFYKLSMIVTMFDLSPDGAFMTDYFPNVKMVKAKDKGDANREYMGYYTNQNLCSHSENSSLTDYERAEPFYKWNRYTFYKYSDPFAYESDFKKLGFNCKDWCTGEDTYFKNFNPHAENKDSNVSGIVQSYKGIQYLQVYLKDAQDIINKKDPSAPIIEVKGAEEDSDGGTLLVDLNENTIYKAGSGTLKIPFTVSDTNKSMEDSGKYTVTTTYQAQLKHEANSSSVIATLDCLDADDLIAGTQGDGGLYSLQVKYPYQYFSKYTSKENKKNNVVNANQAKYIVITATSVVTTKSSGNSVTKTTKYILSLSEMPLFDLE